MAAALIALGYFAVFFDRGRWQPSVTAAWAFAAASWVVACWQRERPSSPRLSHPVWFYALYAAALLPFATDWRWAMTGDNLQWPLWGMELAARGPSRALLSVKGPDNFGYFQMALHNVFMLAVSPTLFWHRVGEIAVGVLALAAVYTVFARSVAPRFGLLVAGCCCSTSIWLVYTYASVPFIDGLACGYAIVAVGLWIRREPDLRRAWLALGGLSGFMLYLTPNAWYLAICVWALLGVGILRRRFPWQHVAAAVSTALVVGTPVLLQWAMGQSDRRFTLVADAAWSFEKIAVFAKEAAILPFSSSIQTAGAFGPQLPLGFRWLFVPGILLTPFFGRRFPGARWVAALYVVQVAALAVSQGSYHAVSVKRALILIPLATYFVFVPFHRWLRTLPPVLALIAAWASFGVYDLAARMQPGRTGYTLLDGVIEVHQRLPEVPICVLVSKDRFVGSLRPAAAANRLYGLAPHVQRVRRIDDPACAHVLCYSPQIDRADLSAAGYEEFPLRNSIELRCGKRGRVG